MSDIAQRSTGVDRHPSVGRKGSGGMVPAKSIAQLRVLLVEDDDGDAYLIKRALRSNSRVGEILHAMDGVDALEMIDSGAARPDMAIIDLHMPRKNGFALLVDLAARNGVQFPSVVLTSSRSGADALRSRKRGAVTYVTKPNTLAKLTHALDKVIASI